MCSAFPNSEYYGDSAPSGAFSRRCAYPRYPARMGRCEEPSPDGSRVHCGSLDRGGARLCPCGLAMATPQTFTMASLASLASLNRVSPAQKVPDRRTRRPGCAAPGPDPPGSSRFRVEGRYDTDSSRAPLDPTRRTRTKLLVAGTVPRTVCRPDTPSLSSAGTDTVCDDIGCCECSEED
jgi:hypothetical protein